MSKLEELLTEAQQDADAFRKHPIYNSEGDGVLLTKTADRIDALIATARENAALATVISTAADAWDAHALATKRCNDAIPEIDSSIAERALYDERYRAAEEARRALYIAAFDLARAAAKARAPGAA